MHQKLRLLGLAAMAALAVAVVPASAAQAAKLTAGPYKEPVYGKQVGTNLLRLADNSNLTWSCENVGMSGYVPGGGTSTPDLHPWFENCTAFGLKAAVNSSGCNFGYNLAESSGPQYPATWDLECSTSGIVLTTLTCEVVFPSQTGLPGANFTNTVYKGWKEVKRVQVALSLAGIDYVVTKDGVGCPLKAKGNYSEAEYFGTTELWNQEGLDLWVES